MTIPVLNAKETATWIAARSHRVADVDQAVRAIIEDVHQRGDAAVIEYANRWDRLEGRSLQISSAEITDARERLDPSARVALEYAAENIRQFAEWQRPAPLRREIRPGVVVGQEIRALPRIGAYIPGGRFPLPSTLLMTVIPAQVAGVREICVCGPSPAEITVGTAGLLGVETFTRVGGAHAIAAMAFGTESIAKVDKIVGPGNAYVASAKKLLAGEVAIDSVAGPSEVVIVSDDGDPVWIAADLLAQAEHDTEASAIWITTKPDSVQAVIAALEEQLATLETAETARESLKIRGAILIADSRRQALEWVNTLAPEHLCLHNPEDATEIEHAGSMFLGPWSAEAYGDYATGPNHVLPTSGFARTKGGLSVLDFLKVITVQEVSSLGAKSLAPVVAELARLEGLEAHARSAEVRG